MSNQTNRLWEFKYTPRKFEDLVLNEEVKEQLKKSLDTRPNLLLFGPAGVGKGSYVNVLINECQLRDYTLRINASNEGGIDTVRDKILPFVNSYSDKLKLVFLNEIDAGQFLASQKALRQIIEDTTGYAQWILACNYIENVIPELKSRCQNINLGNPPAKEIYEKCKFILDSEKIKYKPSSLVELVKRNYPVIRNTIISLSQNIKDKQLKEHISLSTNESVYEKILKAMKDHNPDEVRKLLRSNSLFYQSLYGWFYEKVMDSPDLFKDASKIILLIAEYSYRDLSMSLKEPNFMGCYFHMLQEGAI